MKTLTLDIAGLDAALAAFRDAWNGAAPDADTTRISFASPELLWSVLSAPRWAILQSLAGRQPSTVAEVSERIGRPGDSVAADLDALAHAGLIDRAEGDRFSFPYDTVRVDFVLKAA